MQKIINELLSKNAIFEFKKRTQPFLSKIFLVPKPDGSHRFILNLKDLNNFVLTEHFKLEDYRTLVKLISPGCYLATLDLKDAYYMVPIKESDKKYLCFHFDNKIFYFNVLPFGLSSAPYVFTKIMKPVVSYLRKLGYLSVVYLDDWAIIGNTKEDCYKNIQATRDLLQKLGFIINIDKSQLEPKQTVKFLGFIFDSVEMTIRLPDDKVKKVEDLLLNFIKKTKCKIRSFSQLIGTLISCCPCLKYGYAHTKSLEREKFFALKNSNDCYDNIMNISKILIPDLLWWKDNIRKAKNSIRPRKYNLEIFTDASRTGWGASCGNLRTHGFWSDYERSLHINVLELKTALMGLKCFAYNLKNCNILLRIDNTTAISYINRMGGIRFQILNEIAHELWDYCESREIFVYASYISSKENFLADFESRKREPETEYELSQSVFSAIKRQLGSPKIDLFASRINSKCQDFVSWLPDPDSIATDAFTISWSELDFYAFPPFSMILKVIQKIKEEGARGIVVVPDWPTQPWFPLFKKLACSKILRFKPDRYMLLSPSRKKHPLWTNLTLVAAILCGRRS